LFGFDQFQKMLRQFLLLIRQRAGDQPTPIAAVCGVKLFMLQNIKIARFKSIKLFEFPLENLTVLVGANNSGKSSVLQAIHFAVAIAQSRRRLADQQDVQSEASFGEQLALAVTVGVILAWGRSIPAAPCWV
jgi:excinuclease UvrABC ATPase subunit